MKKVLIVILIVLVGLASIAGCGGSIQSKYDELSEQHKTLQAEKQELQEAFDALQQQTGDEINQLEKERNSLTQELQASKDGKVRYFTNRLEIEYWLASIPNLGVSKDATEWFEFALYYQKKALNDGFIISVSYTFNDDDSVSLTCDVVAEDGWIYYFDPDDLILLDTGIRVDVGNVEGLDNKFSSL